MIEPGIYEDMDEPTYLGAHDYLSSSGCKRLLKSPAHFLLPSNPTEAMDVGSAFHTETLGVGQEVAVIDAASWRGKEAEAAQAKARAEGKAPILAKTVPTIQAMAQAVREHPTAGRLLEQPGRNELSLFWHDPDWGIGRRVRLDTHTDSGVIVDLKSCVSVDRHKIQRSIIDFGYDLSAAFYQDVARGCGLEVSAYALVFVEKTEPYRVRVVELAGAFIERGRVLADNAMQIYLDCREADSWPAYDEPDFTTIYPPAWAREEAS